MNRRRFEFRVALCLTVFTVVPLAAAQTRETEHTFRYDPSATRSKPSLKDIGWLQGAWEGTGFGGISEKIWSEPMANTKMGVYRSVENGAVKFYEINAIVETNGALEMRLKHFR